MNSAIVIAARPAIRDAPFAIAANRGFLSDIVVLQSMPSIARAFGAEVVRGLRALRRGEAVRDGEQRAAELVHALDAASAPGSGSRHAIRPTRPTRAARLEAEVRALVLDHASSSVVSSTSITTANAPSVAARLELELRALRLAARARADPQRAGTTCCRRRAARPRDRYRSSRRRESGNASRDRRRSQRRRGSLDELEARDRDRDILDARELAEPGVVVCSDVFGYEPSDSRGP